MRILLTGGSSGGHLFPLVTVARQIKKTLPEAELFYLGSNFGAEFLLNEEIRIKTILAGKLRRYFSLRTILDILKIPIGFLQALWSVFIYMPDVVFSKGGYDSAPVVFAAWLYRIPILIHESDVIPGLANQWTGKLAKRIAISFSSGQKYFSSKKIALTGHPIRPEIIKGNREEGRKIFGPVSEKPVVLILGGSQGAESINEIIFGTLPRLLEKYEIIHMTGPKNYETIKKLTRSKVNEAAANYHIHSFLDENQLKNAYALADLIISRAGAGSIFEISACGKPSILIPLPSAASAHQKENAFEYTKYGAGVIIEQANLTPHLFLNEIKRILDNPDLAQKMSQAAKNFSKPEASQKIADELIELGS